MRDKQTKNGTQEPKPVNPANQQEKSAPESKQK